MKEILLKTGGVAFVDDEDFLQLKDHEWYAIKTQKNIYAVRCIYDKNTQKVRHLRMHREILNVNNPNVFVDHKDHNTLNNQKSNLRLCTHQQNMFNRRKVTGKSIYKGVVYREERDHFFAIIKVGGCRIYLGSYQTEIEAAMAYNEAALKYHGEFACTNKI